VFGVGHGHNLFQVHLLVPLLMWGPGIPARSVDHNVSLIDAAPTFLQVLDVEAPEMDGRRASGPFGSTIGGYMRIMACVIGSRNWSSSWLKFTMLPSC